MPSPSSAIRLGALTCPIVNDMATSSGRRAPPASCLLAVPGIGNRPWGLPVDPDPGIGFHPSVIGGTVEGVHTHRIIIS